MYRLGIDVGSKTIKVVLMDESGKVVYSDYDYHNSKVQEALQNAIHRAAWLYEDCEVQATVTGSAGMRVAELFDIPFTQEVVALKRAVEHYLPGTDVILEMGGEDTKLVYLTGVPEQRMNTICAGGTGGFIDAMAGLMGESNEDDRMNILAMGHTRYYPIASRCAVFAKSDVRPLLNAGAHKSDIAASVLRAVCTQAVAGLSAGRPIKGKVALLGGPFEYIPMLRESFCDVTGISKEDAVTPKDAHLFVASGAAMAPEYSAPVRLSQLEAQISAATFENDEGMKRLPALFKNDDEYDEFRLRHAQCVIPRAGALTEGENNMFIGIDAGSTTLKMAVVDESGALCDFEYEWNEGDLTVSFPKMLEKISGRLNGRWAANTKVRRSCTVGYGENFCKAAYHVDEGEVETVAHLRAAVEIDPDVDFLMDIGGQDIKCFYVKDGAIEDIVLNEACSSGCGSLFDSIARSMNRTKERFADDALFAKAPVDLGTRCSTFMDSRVKHAQKEGVPTDDIAAGVCYSTVRNALFKVVRQPDFTKVGKHIVVQGGAFANDAILRAFELETGVQVKRPDLSQIMGAWGAALLARDAWLAERQENPEAAAAEESGLLSPQQIEGLRVKTSTDRCGLCANNCELVLTTFFTPDCPQGRTLVSGNRCERGALSHGDAQRSARTMPPNMIKAKNALLDKYDRTFAVKAGEDANGPVVGIPRALSLYESYPFWKTFFAQLGYATTAAAESNEDVYRLGMGCVPAESACYPSKLLYGHCVDAVQKGAGVLFIPQMGLRFAREGLLGKPVDNSLHECPLIENMPQMVESNGEGSPLEGIALATPDFTGAHSLEEAVPELVRALGACGLVSDEGAVRAALKAAQEEYLKFFQKLDDKNRKVLARIDAGEFPGALVAGHPYHTDPGISHRIDELLGELGYAVVERLDYAFACGEGETEGASGMDASWVSSRDLLDATAASAHHPNLQLIVPRSFGCGVDALAADAVHDLVRGSGRIYAELKTDQIVDLAAVRIRLRSLGYAARQRQGKTKVYHLYGNALQHAEQQRSQEIAKEKQRIFDRKERERLGEQAAATVNYEERYAEELAGMKRLGYTFDRLETYEAERKYEPVVHKDRFYRGGHAYALEEHAQIALVFKNKDGQDKTLANWTAVKNFLLANKWQEEERKWVSDEFITMQVGRMEKLGYHFTNGVGDYAALSKRIMFDKPGVSLYFENWRQVLDFINHPVNQPGFDPATAGDLPPLPGHVYEFSKLVDLPPMPPKPGEASGERIQFTDVAGR